MYDLGIVIGKYAPLTRGHINLINHALTASNKVRVVVSHDQRWVDAQNPRDRKRLTWQNRVRWIKQTFKQLPEISVSVLDESEIRQYPDGWNDFVQLLKAQIVGFELMFEEQHGRKPTIAIFSSEFDYDQQYQKLLPEWNHEVVDSGRTNVPISATMIRENLYENWEYIPSIVRQDYTLRICIIGLESCAKSTLTKCLANLFNTSWVEEYGRTFCEDDLCGDERLLRSEDYSVIAYRHKELEREAMRNANRICFIDTNAFITEFYHRLYEGKPHPVVTAMAHDEHYDVILNLHPTVPWVDDGLRLNSDRTHPKELYEDMFEEFKDVFDSSVVFQITDTSYTARMQKAVAAVNWVMANFNTGAK